MDTLELPDGYELLPAGEPVDYDHWYTQTYRDAGGYIRAEEWKPVFQKSQVQMNRHIYTVIRPVQKGHTDGNTGTTAGL